MKIVDKFNPYLHPFKVHVPELLNETFMNAVRPNDLGALKVPLNIFILYLKSLSERCAELNDPVLNKIMIDMTLYEESDISSKEYNKEMVERVNEEYNNYLISKS